MLFVDLHFSLRGINPNSNHSEQQNVQKQKQILNGHKIRQLNLISQFSVILQMHHLILDQFLFHLTILLIIFIKSVNYLN